MGWKLPKSAGHSSDENAMPENENRGSHLRTKYVFVDTQAFRKARFDWNGRSLKKLTEFANQGQLRLLVTDVTIGEVKSQLQELLTEANSSLNKHSGILEQLGASVAVDRVRDQATALRTLEAAFDEFLKRIDAVNIPLISDVKGVLEDYFARQPPFSTKKKAEFPDAISIASIRGWCQQYHLTAYIVSDDPDLRACCSDSGPLFQADSITEIISQATVSQELHQALEKALRDSEYLRESLVEEIYEMVPVRVERSSSFRRAVSLTAKIDDVHSVNIISVNVFEQQEQTFTCELEVEADVTLDIDVEIEGGYGYGGPDDYEPPEHHSIRRSKTEYLYAETVVRFEPPTGDLEFESISMVNQAIRIGFDDLEGH